MVETALSSMASILIPVYVVFLVAFMALLRYQGRSRGIPGMAISLGITFTFIGIFIALFGFDTSDIQNSIPQLLDGMRLAFATSIMGMSTAVLYRVFSGLRLWEKADEEQTESEVDTIRKLDASQAKRHKQQMQGLKGIHMALAGEGETTLLTQIQKLRMSFTDKQDEMITAFETFSEQMAEDQTEALIDALQEVIRDFNTQINEQFGDNFKQLNEAVGRMLDWQKEYKTQVEGMTEQMQNALKGVRASEAVLKKTAGHVGEFVKSAKHLEEIIQTYHREIQVLEQHLEAFAHVAEEAKNGFPRIQENVEHLSRQFRDSTDTATTQMESAARAHRQSVTEMMNKMHDNQRQLSRNLEQIKQKASEDIAGKIEVLDQEMERELKGAIENMGGHLASLSKEFVNDYRPLTRELQRLVESSKGVNGHG